MATATFNIALANTAFFARMAVTVEAGTDAARIACEAAERLANREWAPEEEEMAIAIGQEGPGAYRVTRCERAEADELVIGIETLKTGSNG